jgi:rSAM/selenodomain-associated transferase 1
MEIDGTFTPHVHGPNVTRRSGRDACASGGAGVSVAIAIMAKAPLAGRCKTRLLPLVSGEQAAELSTAFLRDIMDNLTLAGADGSISPYIAYAPAESGPVFARMFPAAGLLLADGVGEVPAGVEGFGRCLLQAVQAMLALGHSAACVLNADSPTLPTRVLRRAAALLAAPGKRAVMGPAEDGGYYLLGMQRTQASLFSGIDWSTERVAAQTRMRAQQAGLELCELDMWYDVDEPALLHRLMRELTAGGAESYPAPHTAGCIARLGLERPAGASSDTTHYAAGAAAAATGA